MAVAMLTWMFAIPLLGLTTGLRSMTPMALLCWFARLGYLPLDGTWAFWIGNLWVAIAFTVLALAELAADKTTWIPDRVSTVPVLWRVVLGGLAGAAAATYLAGSIIEGFLLAVIGTLFGAFGGYMVRRHLVETLGCPDWQVAIVEDIITIGGAGFALHVITG